MPELPDVEIFKQYLDATSLHQEIESVEVRNDEILGDVSARELRSTLKGQRFESTRRHGKHLFAQLDAGGWLMMHFGMTGRLKYFKDIEKDPTHDRLLIGFEGGYHLAFDCRRMFGKVDLIEDPEDFIEAEELGPDLLALDFAAFRERLEGRRGSVKSALMNQQVLAGIGNIYSDEILFQARLHPKTGVKELDEAALKDLFEEIQQVLQTAIESRADPKRLPDSFLLPHRHEGEECPRGNGRIEQIKISDRSAYYCPACQPEEREERPARQPDEWEELKRQATERFGRDAVFGEGPVGARLAIVGEAPGKQEVEEGRPFVGRAGKLLDKILEEAGIDRSEVYVTNVVKIRPTKESEGRTQNRPPRAGEIEEGIEILGSELGLVGPNALVLLGGTPAKALIKKSFTLKSERGDWFDSEVDILALATYHPAYLLRLRGDDFKQARELVARDLGTAWERARHPYGEG